jgi:ParB-like chromosome segregation protein Spo0J
MPHITHETIRVEDVLISQAKRRPLNDEGVAALKISIQAMGLRTPIAVQWVQPADENKEPETYLVAGAHRLEAFKQLGRKEIDCVYFDVGEEITARLWEISENLHRVDLEPVERAEHRTEWLRLRQQQIEEASLQLAQIGPIETKRKDGKGHRKQGGSRAAERELGVNHAEAGRDAKIADLPTTVKKAAQKAGVKTQTDLLKIARAGDEEAQLAAVEKLAKAKVDPCLQYKEQIEPGLWAKLEAHEDGKYTKQIYVLKSIAAVKEGDQPRAASRLTGLPYEMSETEWNDETQVAWTQFCESWANGKPAWQRKRHAKMVPEWVALLPAPAKAKAEKPVEPPPKAEKPARKPKVAKAA